MSETRLQRYRAKLSQMAQCLWGILTRIKTTGITWCRSGVIRGRLWVRTLGDVARKAGSPLRRHAFLLGVILALILFGLAVWKVPQRQVAGATLSDKERLELIDKARGTLAQIFAGLGIALGLIFTWKNLTVAREGQITERFTRAIDQLGSDRLEIRLGGIYALERIARDSAKDHWPIMEVLTAYVREHTPWQEPPQSMQDISPKAADPTPEGNSQQPKLPPSPDTAIQAILTVLGRRTRVYGKGEERRLDLRGTDLRRAELAGAHLEWAHLGWAHLEWAHLEGAELERADLGGAYLERAMLLAAYLKGAHLWEANLEEAYLGFAHLKGAMLADAHLKGAMLADAHLKGAMLADAHLEDADLGGAHLEDANLRGAYLEGAILRGTHLAGADLHGVHGLTQEQIAQAYTEGAQLPDYLNIPQ